MADFSFCMECVSNFQLTTATIHWKTFQISSFIRYIQRFRFHLSETSHVQRFPVYLDLVFYKYHAQPFESPEISSKDKDSNINKILISRIVCCRLAEEVCAFSVSSYRSRCVFEKSILTDGNECHCQCQVGLNHCPLRDYLPILIICLRPISIFID
jgi:hypothetical protein